MKVIDLLILKYKNKPLPEKIRFDLCEWKLTKGGNDYIHYAVCLEYFWHKLGKEVEILEPAEELTLIEELEEDKEIDEINFITEHDSFSTIDQYKPQEIINKLIRELNELKKGK